MDINEEKAEEYRKVFAIFDKDDTATIATSDLGDALRVLGYNPTDEEIDQLVQEASERVNDDGRIEFDEFCHLLSGRAKDLDEEEKDLMEAFRVFDKNQNGTLNKAELREVLSNLGMTKMTNGDIDEFFTFADENEDGAISYAELVQVIMGKR